MKIYGAKMFALELFACLALVAFGVYTLCTDGNGGGVAPILMGVIVAVRFLPLHLDKRTYEKQKSKEAAYEAAKVKVLGISTGKIKILQYLLWGMAIILLLCYYVWKSIVLAAIALAFCVAVLVFQTVLEHKAEKYLPKDFYEEIY